MLYHDYSTKTVLVRALKLLVPDDQTGLISHPVYICIPGSNSLINEFLQ